MTWIRRHLSVLAWLIVGILFFVILVLLYRENERSTEAARRAEAAVQGLEAETRIRTLQNCQQTVNRSLVLRQLLQDAANMQPDPARRQATLAYIAQNFPPLKCDDQGQTIVLPEEVPPEASTTTTEG